MRVRTIVLWAVLTGWLVGPGGMMRSLGEEETASDPQTESRTLFELLQWIKEHWADVPPQEIDQAALQGLSARFGGRLIREGASQRIDVAIKKETRLFEEAFLYVRLPRLDRQAPEILEDAYERHRQEGSLEGLILDLRFARGSDYEASARIAGRFLTDEGPLLKWDGTAVGGRSETAPIRVPVAVLINGETAQAAEALAALLRETGVGLLIGSRTAGEPFIYEKVRLENNQVLQIARETVKLKGNQALPVDGIVPDIKQEVSREDTLAYLGDPYQTLSPESDDEEADPSSQGQLMPEGTGRDLDDEPDEPVIQDPSLARAIDLLKGLRLIKGLESK